MREDEHRQANIAKILESTITYGVLNPSNANMGSDIGQVMYTDGLDFTQQG